MTDKDQDRANSLLAKSPLGASVSHRDLEHPDPIGASGKQSEMNGEAVGASGKHGEMNSEADIGASDTHSNLNNDGVIGASGTHSNAINEAGLGAGGKYSEMNGETAIGADVIHRKTDGDRSVGASVTHRETNGDDPVGASGSHNGASGTTIGASGTLVGASDTHRIGASGTFHWRDWHSLISLTPGFKHFIITSTTPSAGDGLDAVSEVCGNETGVVAGEWKIADLLALNRISAKNQDQLLEKGITAQAFISWLLYAASKVGNNIRDPIGHAVSRLVQDPIQGAGGVYDRLAGLPANELTNLLKRELNLQSPRNTDWRTVMDGTTRTRLRALANQLGLPIPDTND